MAEIPPLSLGSRLPGSIAGAGPRFQLSRTLSAAASQQPEGAAEAIQEGSRSSLSSAACPPQPAGSLQSARIAAVFSAACGEARFSQLQHRHLCSREHQHKPQRWEKGASSPSSPPRALQLSGAPCCSAHPPELHTAHWREIKGCILIDLCHSGA